MSRAEGPSRCSIGALPSLCYPAPMQLRVELEREEDGRWIADVVDLPGVLVYGQTPEQALRDVRALALRALADKLEHGELDASVDRLEFQLPQPIPAA